MHSCQCVSALSLAQAASPGRRKPFGPRALLISLEALRLARSLPFQLVMALFFDDLPKVAYSESKIPWNSVSNASTATSLSNSIHSRTDVIDDIGSDDQSTDFLPHSNLFSALESLSESAEANQPLSPLTSGALLSYESELRAKSRSCGVPHPSHHPEVDI